MEDAQVACPLLVDVGLRAILTHRISTHSTMVLSENGSEVSEADDAIGLLLVVLFPFEFDVYFRWEVPAMERLTNFCPPPTENDLE